VTGSPAKTTGGAAAAASVIGGAFLHPSGTKTKDAEASTKQTDFKFCETMYPPQPLVSTPVEWIVYALHLQE
jgi:hypothetical protein